MTTEEILPGFSPYTLTGHPEGFAISTSPGDGWLIKITRKDADTTWTERVVAWVLQSSGTVLPLCLEDPGEGSTYFPTLDATLKCHVYHPDAPQTATE
ncbi:hypothetical protein GPZ77_34460 (plasmid) [Streptomyces sp. QHH-9511]|uniref:hypothetical protein n=1 Tax=Streptomyces sp. QHH-9511 TaxID=2684468 RepID=UPI0013169394|nr:hypothetical protein [Streptomyces sp. QHH-9511]QGZ53335.1 hypothetical protein GPZ77_34460 [Streptomyces sp. QHH-9511]